MEKRFMGVLVAKISGVFVRGLAAILPCREGSFDFQAEEGELEDQKGGDGNAYASWGDRENNRYYVFADEVTGVRSREG